MTRKTFSRRIDLILFTATRDSYLLVLVIYPVLSGDACGVFHLNETNKTCKGEIMSFWKLCFMKYLSAARASSYRVMK